MEVMKDIDNYLEADQINQLLNIIPKENDRDFLLLSLLWRTGMRITEAIRLEYRSIDWDNGFINIRRETAKRNKARRVPIDTNTLRMIKQYCNRNKIYSNLTIFLMTRQRAWQIIKKYAEKVNLNIHPHTFRHSFAINCVRQGVDIITLSKWLGHSDPKTTAIYLRFRDKDMKEIYNQVQF